MVLELGDGSRRALDLGLDHLTVLAGRVGQHGLGGLVVGACLAQLAPGRDDLAELLVASREIAQSVGVGGRGRLGEVALDLLVFLLEGAQALVEHRLRLPSASLRAAPGRGGGTQDFAALDFALRSP